MPSKMCGRAGHPRCHHWWHRAPKVCALACGCGCGASTVVDGTTDLAASGGACDSASTLHEVGGRGGIDGGALRATGRQASHVMSRTHQPLNCHSIVTQLPPMHAQASPRPGWGQLEPRCRGLGKSSGGTRCISHMTTCMVTINVGREWSCTWYPPYFQRQVPLNQMADASP